MSAGLMRLTAAEGASAASLLPFDHLSHEPPDWPTPTSSVGGKHFDATDRDYEQFLDTADGDADGEEGAGDSLRRLASDRAQTPFADVAGGEDDPSPSQPLLQRRGASMRVPSLSLSATPSIGGASAGAASSSSSSAAAAPGTAVGISSYSWMGSIGSALMTLPASARYTPLSTICPNPICRPVFNLTCLYNETDPHCRAAECAASV